MTESARLIKFNGDIKKTIEEVGLHWHALEDAFFAFNMSRHPIVRNLIGRSILESISGLSTISCYFSHVGTLQHKIAFSTLAPGVVHGPRSQLSKIDSGPFQAELGRPPIYLDASTVDDVGPSFERGPSVSDYVISDTEACARIFRDMVVSSTEKKRQTLYLITGAIPESCIMLIIL